MTFSSWRGVVGMINPTLRPGVTEEVIRLLPEGMGSFRFFSISVAAPRTSSRP